MKNILVSAIYTSPPNTMGGNTKIMIELLRYIQTNTDDFIIIFTTEPETFKKYLDLSQSLKIIDVPYPFKKLSVTTHVFEIFYLINFYKKFFKTNKEYNSSNTLFYSCSDWWPDVLPLAYLKILNFQFKWISTLFLFIPDIFENIFNKYNFPLFKYLIYYFYQKFAFLFIKNLSYKTVITNQLDTKFFPKNYYKNVYSIYGGVNIETVKSTLPQKNLYDGIYCGRLHPQKGCDLLIKIWSDVVKKVPNAKLAIIGNGEKSYEEYLYTLVKNYNLTNNITFLGYINDHEKYILYKSSKMLLHTSVYDNNGMVAAEALCSGIPVIMFNHEYLKEIYTDYCIKVEDTTSYSENVIRILEDSGLQDSLTPKGQDLEKLQTFWNWENRIKSLYLFLIN